MGYFTNYPKHVFLILSNEFCERFSYYGMKAILVIYLNLALGFSEDTSVSIYHAFNCVCYFTPLLGAMIADGWLGKYKTILYVSMIYALGNIVMTVTAIPMDNGDWVVWPPFIGLTIIAFGTGGIKPCVSAFGGDQFSKDQQRQKDSFFSLFYMAINIGSLLSTIITPLVRSNVDCFGQECYAVAFGIPAALMIVAIIVFALGSRFYTKIPPGESLLIRMFGCIGTALKGKCGCCTKGPKEKKDHWLDYAEPKYDKQFISDVKDVMSVCWLFIPLPIFWSLFDQQSSRWTLQAKKLNGDMGSVVIQPDMMQAMNALLVVLFVPILESLIYPCLDKLRIPNRPLQRMGWGMAFAATAFLMAGFLQIGIDNESPATVSPEQVKFNFLNTEDCTVTINPFVDEITDPIVMEPYTNTEYYYINYDPNIKIQFNSLCGSTPYAYTFDISQLSPELTYQIVTGTDSATMFNQTVVDFTLDLQATIRVYNGLDAQTNMYVKVGSADPVAFMGVTPNNFSEYAAVKLDDIYMVITDPVTTDNTSQIYLNKTKNGALYTLLVYPGTSNIQVSQLFEIEPRGINIFIQVPQYMVMTMGECLFSVTGLGFAYSQASPSMKSILTAIWLLTVAIGNIVVVIVEEAGSSLSQMVEFFLFSGIMYVTTGIFVIMCFFYTYVEPRVYSATISRTSSTSSGSSKKSGEKQALEYVNDDNISEKKDKVVEEVTSFRSSKSSESEGHNTSF